MHGLSVVTGPEKVSGPGCRVRVLDPTRYPKDPTRRTRVGSNLYILCFHHGVRVNLVAIVSSDFYVPSFLVEQSGGTEIFFQLEEIRKIRDNGIL